LIFSIIQVSKVAIKKKQDMFGYWFCNTTADMFKQILDCKLQ